MVGSPSGSPHNDFTTIFHDQLRDYDSRGNIETGKGRERGQQQVVGALNKGVSPKLCAWATLAEQRDVE